MGFAPLEEILCVRSYNICQEPGPSDGPSLVSLWHSRAWLVLSLILRSSVGSFLVTSSKERLGVIYLFSSLTVTGQCSLTQPGRTHEGPNCLFVCDAARILSKVQQQGFETKCTQSSRQPSACSAPTPFFQAGLILLWGAMREVYKIIKS